MDDDGQSWEAQAQLEEQRRAEEEHLKLLAELRRRRVELERDSEVFRIMLRRVRHEA